MANLNYLSNVVHVPPGALWVESVGGASEDPVLQRHQHLDKVVTILLRLALGLAQGHTLDVGLPLSLLDLFQLV